MSHTVDTGRYIFSKTLSLTIAALGGFLAAKAWDGLFSRGSFTALVTRDELWICNTGIGAMAGPFPAADLEGGVYALTGCKEPLVGRVLFRDETLPPGRIRLEVSGQQLDILEGRGVYFQEDWYDWKSPACNSSP